LTSPTDILRQVKVGNSGKGSAEATVFNDYGKDGKRSVSSRLDFSTAKSPTFQHSFKKIFFDPLNVKRMPIAGGSGRI
jgi:hypothetical protein